MCDCSQDCKDYAKISKWANCVIKRRANQTKRRAKLKRQIIDYLGGECVDCGMMAAVVDRVTRLGKVTLAPLCAFDVEHNWKKKGSNIGSMSTCGWEKVKKELDNGECVLVCKICHSIRTRKLTLDPEFSKIRADKNKKTWANQYSEAPQPLNSTSA